MGGAKQAKMLIPWLTLLYFTCLAPPTYLKKKKKEIFIICNGNKHIFCKICKIAHAVWMLVALTVCLDASCADQLPTVFTSIFNTYLVQCVGPPCFKLSTTAPVSENNEVSCLNSYCPVALTCKVMKCFKRLVKDICCSLPSSFDHLQFTYRSNRNTDDTICNKYWWHTFSH